MKLKNLSRLTALLLAFILCFSSVAQAISLEDLTAEQLNTWFMAVAKNFAIATQEVIGFPVDLKCKDGEDKTGYTFQWYKLVSDDKQEIVDSEAGRSSILTVVTTTEEQSYYCVATDSEGKKEYSKLFILAPYTSKDADQYLSALYTIWGEYREDQQISYRFEAYRLMKETWNVTLSGDTQNLAKAIMEYYAQNQDDFLLCTCGINTVVNETDGTNTITVADEILHQPYGVHEKDCPWYEGSIIIPPIPPQPEPKGENPNGKQYISNKEYTLPMTKAIILPEGGSATVTVSGSAVSAQTRGVTSPVQWQVYTGTEWANMLGETSSTLVVTTAKLQTIFNLTGVAHLRYYDRTNDVVLGYVDVTSQAIAGGEYPEETTQTISVESRDMTAQTRNGTYNVVVNYLFENNEIAADPYTANLAAGSNFSTTLIFPTVQGYLPYRNDVQENSLQLDIKNIQADVTYNVVYKPTNVNYTVIHYQQNLNDDKYTEVSRETKQGLTNSIVPEVAKTYEGFYALLYEKPAIAADGSTKVEIYYDRYYYLMNFDLDGGYGVEPIYARHGAPIGNVGTPTKAGYSFAGWSLDGTTVVDLPSTMPAENRTYKAVWQADATAKVTVVFWGENADDEAYSYIKSAQVNVKPGTEFTYSESGALICALEEHTHSIDKCYELTCTQEPHTHDENCYTCGQTSHTHDTSCYDGVGVASNPGTGAPSNPANGYVAREAWSWDGKVIYINGTWYKYTGNTATGNNAPTTCGKTEGTHTHTDKCLGCGKTEHTHSIEKGCYELTCTKPVHSHTSDCYMGGAGLDTNLWKFVRSDTVTVAADGSSVVNVYYDRTTFTLKFVNDNTIVKTISEKWGKDIHSNFPIKSGSSTMWWNVPNNCVSFKPGTQLGSINTMPAENITFTFYQNQSGAKIYYYVETIDGAAGVYQHAGKNYIEYKVIDLKNSSSVNLTYTEEFHDIVGFQQFWSDPAFDKMEQGGTADMKKENILCYNRNVFGIEYFNPTELIKKEASVPYDKNLATYYWEPTSDMAPAKYEPGSVQFAGWYLNPDCSGELFDFSKHTMPAGPNNKNGETALSLYAKWVPVTHKVQFYQDQAALTAGTKLSTHPDITVPHGSKADPTPADPTNGSYTFVGWFYMDGYVEKAFDFANMPVKKDLQVYGKWSSNVLKQYTIYYKYKDADGNEIEIADTTTGSGLAGVTKTFDAKGGTELYADYQEGYFPVVKSHSMTIDIDATEENKANVFTFWYVQKDAVPYTVKYLNKETGEPVADEKTVSDNRKAVVTETFVPVSGMMPDAYQKRLVVSAEEGAVNEIIFYYTEDTTHAYYKITHFTENLGTDAQGTTWTEYASSQVVGNIGETYTANSMTIPGFTYDSKVPGTVVSGELTSAGLELKLYYTRNSYPYQVRYLEQGTGKQLADPKDSTGKYGQVISESAIDIDNYTAVDPTSQTLNIRIEESTEAKLNIITFYYTENEATINYVVVGPDGCGTVSPTSETLKVLSGTAQGSTASAKENFKFVGWYSDEACNGDPISTDATYVPTKAQGAAWVDGTTYYAKFEYNLTTLTIKKEGMDAIDAGQSFLFKVTGYGLPGDGLLIAIYGNGEETISGLTVGQTYTVTEVESWSWRYTAESEQKITLNPTGNKVTIKNGRDHSQWLDGDCYAENVFNTQGTGN